MSLAIRGVKTSLSTSVRNCLCRSLSTTNPCHGKKNFRKFYIHNFRGTRIFRQQQKENPDPNIPIETFGVRPVGYKHDNKFHVVPEMIPELVVPNLDNFKLKPYVSYRAPDVVQSEFTARDLFDAVYAKKVVEDFKAGKLDDNGQPLEPSPMEKITKDQAVKNARKIGNDF
ncbi:hypothetical protein B566_EDAN017249 [Ephemera danica]|nr:hypothetical protein B566_EDAN010322 [Ephemera danica]KAF4528772.1 hypothetical protein B566_EDAN017249 [Ephemera danica]